MICLRCGYCCKNMLVSIVDDIEKGIEQDNIIMHEGNNTPCKHLRGDKEGEYSCSIHNKDWYCETPCYSHTQIESKNSNCRTGEFMLKKKGLL